jgi:hypothetical protein
MANVTGAAMEESFKPVIGEPGCTQVVEYRRTDQETKKKRKPKTNTNRKKIKNALKMKKTMKMNGKKSIETNPMLNVKMSMNVNEKMNELESTYESHDECEEECEYEAEYDAANGESRYCCALAAKRLSNVLLCAGSCLVMSTAKAHLLTISGARDQQCIR